MDVYTLITSQKKKNEKQKTNNHIIHFQTFKEKNLK